MKKLILGMLAAVVMTASVSAIEFSAGGGFGTIIGQFQNNDNAFSAVGASPVFGIVGNADFNGWGVQVSIDINRKTNDKLVSNLYTEKSSDTDTILALTPYFTFKLGEFTFAAGPAFAIDFYSYNYNYTPVAGDGVTIKSSATTVMLGGLFEARKSITDHVGAYVSLPVIYQGASQKAGSYTYNGVAATPSPDYDKWAGWYAWLKFAPKIGVVYKF